MKYLLIFVSICLLIGCTRSKEKWYDMGFKDGYDSIYYGKGAVLHEKIVKNSSNEWYFTGYKEGRNRGEKQIEIEKENEDLKEEVSSLEKRLKHLEELAGIENQT